jgi:hypothetical protein
VAVRGEVRKMMRKADHKAADLIEKERLSGDAATLKELRIKCDAMDSLKPPAKP